jgi:hypothetical protein
MIGMEWILDSLLVVLLMATLVHAIRLERALGALKRDRSALETLVGTFNASTLAAEAGIESLRAATDGAGRQIQRQINTATTLKDDLTFMVQRGEGLADRLDELVRAARPMIAGTGQPVSRATYMRPEAPDTRLDTRDDEPRLRSQAERDLLKALRMVK